MSSSGTIFDTTPLLPWRPAILSPGWILRFTATKTLTIFITPGGSSSPRCSFSTLSRKRCSSRFFDSSYCLRMASISAISLSLGEANSHHCERGCSSRIARVILESFLKPFGPGDALPVLQQLAEAAVDVAVEDRLLVVAVLGEALDFFTLDRERALVLVDAVAVEHAHLDDRALHARRHAQRGVAHVGGLLAEDGAQELFLRRHRAFALRRDLAAQDVAGAHLGADIDDARFVEVLQRLFRDVRNVARDFLRPELGVARHHLEFLDVDRGEHVVLHDPLGEQDRVLEVVAIPRHERDEHVAAERELAEFGRGTVGDDVALLDLIAHLHQRTLVDAGVLVRALELHQPIDVDARLRRIVLLGRADDDTGGVDLIDHAGAARGDRGAASRGRPRPPCRCRRTAPRREPAAPPGAACSSPSARGWRRRSRGTGSAPPRPKRAASATRP